MASYIEYDPGTYHQNGCDLVRVKVCCRVKHCSQLFEGFLLLTQPLPVSYFTNMTHDYEALQSLLGHIECVEVIVEEWGQHAMQLALLGNGRSLCCFELGDETLKTSVELESE